MSIKKTVIGALPKHIMEIAIISIVFFILFFGLPANFNNEILIGRISYLITFLIIASRIYPSVSSIARLKGQLEYTRSSLKFFDKVKHIFNKKYLKKELNIQTINKSFEIKNLNFFFNKNCIFKDANLKVHRKDFIYIDGKNGSGKTTLFDILVGIISLNGKQNGQFLIDKKKLTLNQDSNPFASYAAQDPLIFNQTIRDNITLNYPFDKKELLEILKMSCLFDVINKYPKGLNTILGEGGIKLSKGNIQRVALARALLYLKNTTHKVLILDEATSAIDSQSEKKIFKNLKKSNLYDLLFYTSHNLSNQKYANKKSYR
jgi:ABC-type bacteriocin/lantibiotic exporter with double-glycine peptidase domain